MNILILCTGNTCRSPMAEGIVKDLIKRKGLSDEMRVQSMGLAAYEGQMPSDHAVEAMAELGLDIAGHRARRVVQSDVSHADLCYVMTEQHKHIVLDSLPELEGQVVVLDVSDPYGGDLDRYRRCRDELKDYFEAEFRRMEKQDDGV